ncbi:MAG: TonB-dependent receptor [Bacteroidales bacterium]|nr:TonB-dependent receptor [Bacteroidales bacterium]
MKFNLFRFEGSRDRKIKIKTLFFSVFLFVLTHAAFAQEVRTVTGTIVDEAGEPLAGANVVVKGTTTGAVANADGKFSINVPATGGNTLVFSFIGYVAQEIAVAGRTSLSVTMAPSSVDLDEVVVVGYGVQKKVNLTGSVSQIGGQEVIKAPSANVGHMIVGKIPGVLSSQANGAPGTDGVTFQVRGYASWEGSSPLILVDGVVRDFSNIDPNDIETISVLKDGAAAVYGFRAANGVILVTTKRGAQGGSRPSISYSGSVSFSKNTQLPKFMNGTEYMNWYNKARELDGQPVKFTDEEIAMTQNGDPTDGYENTDWMSPMNEASPMHQHNLQVRGSAKNVRYFVSGGFKDQRAFFRDYKYQTTNLRSNVDVDPVKYLTLSLDLGATFSRLYRPGAYTYTNQEYNNVVGVLMYALPFVPKEYNGYPTSGYRGGGNPEYARDHSGFAQTDRNTVQSKAGIEFRVPGVDGLKASFTAVYDFADSDGMTFTYAYKLYQYQFASKSYALTDAMSLNADGNMYQGRNRSSRMVLRPAISYDHQFGKHDVSALALLERTDYRESSISGSRTGFVLFENPELNFGTNSGTTYNNSGTSSQTLMAGWVGRLNYAYASKYLVEFSFRYDGSYRFAPEYRWGFFPSISAGWVISDESFWNVRQIDRLKIRASASRLGNDTTPADLWRRLYTAGGDAPVTFGGKDYKILSNNNTYLAPELTWAKTNTYNLGMEFSLWNGVLSGEADVFYKFTYDILQGIAAVYPPSLGENYPTRENSGEFEAKGFEVLLRHTESFGGFRYSLTGNISYSTNKILKRNQSGNVLPWQDLIGTSVGDVFGYRATGLARTQEDLDHAAIAPSGSLRALVLGDILYEDVNGDGEIDSRDQVKIARSSMPKMMYSFAIDMSCKGFDLSAQFQGAALMDKMLCGTWDNNANDNTPLTRPFYGNSDNSPLYLIEEAWRPDNPNGKYPRLSASPNYGNSGLKSSFWKVNGAYLRLKQLALGYTLPKNITSAIGIDHLRLYVAGLNLFTLTEFKYLDPEAPNVLQGYYPQQRTLSIGLNLTF